MSVSGMSDLLETPDGLDSLDKALTEDLIDANDQDEDDSSLLDAAPEDDTVSSKRSTPSLKHILTDDLIEGNDQEEEDSSLLDAAPGEDTEEIEDLKARVKEMEEEAEKLKEIQGEVEKQMMSSAKSPTGFPTAEEKLEADIRSVYVGNVDYQSTAEELGQHFQGCGAINRVTILCDKFTGHPKGFAYIEFVDKISVTQSLDLDDSLFKGRQIKVMVKRTNRPGVSTTNRGARSRGGGRGRGGFRGAYNNPYMGGMMMMPMPMGYYRGGRGRAYRGRARTNWYAPY